MASTTPESPSRITRKKFLVWSSLLLALLGFLRWFKPNREKPAVTKRKFLTRDGQLVQVDEQHVAQVSKKMYTSELKSWIQK